MHFILIQAIEYNTVNRFWTLIWIYSDEKEKYDPAAFRDAILQGIAESGSSLDQVLVSANYAHHNSCENRIVP